jgi:signal transduction histidine kinase
MIGTSIVVLTTHRQTKRQITRALVSSGSVTTFVENLPELSEAIAQVNPALLILDTDDSDGAAVENMLSAAHAKRALPIVLLSVSKDKSPLASLVERHDISNLVAKHGAIRASYPTLDERELVATCEKVLQRNIFGIDKYIGNWGVLIHHAEITGQKDKAPFLARFEQYLRALEFTKSVIPDVITVADELIMNAMVHAPRDAAGNPKYEMLNATKSIELAPHEFIKVEFGCDGQRVMLSVSDNFGTLDKKKVHLYLSRAFGPPLTPEDKPGGAGIGLSMSYRSIHQLIFNVHESKRTEAIAGWYLDVATGAEFRQVAKSLNLFWLPEDSEPLSNVPNTVRF